jgi:hypothetical protein
MIAENCILNENIIKKLVWVYRKKNNLKGFHSKVLNAHHKIDIMKLKKRIGR